MLWVLSIVFIISLDQLIKGIINRKVNIVVTKPIFKKVFYITHLENFGVALNIMDNKGFIFVPIIIVSLIIIEYLLYTSNNMTLKLSLSFILGGGIGNLIDRLRKRSVTDFFEVHLFRFILPIFNIADIFIFVGVILFSFNF